MALTEQQPLTRATVSARGGHRRRRFPAWSLIIALALVAIILLVTILAQVIAPEPLEAAAITQRLQPPSAHHLLGTDQLGRDIVSQLFYATQASVLIAGSATLLSGLIGAVLGALAGWFGKGVDTVVSFFIDVQSSIPAFILALGALVFFGGTPTVLVIILAVEGWERIARVTRAEVMSVRRSGYVQSTLNLGVSRFTTVRHHLLPALVAPLVVQITLAFPTKILLESALSFLGLGIRPPATSLGQMVGTGEQYLASAWWVVVVPGLAIFLISLAVGIIGDHLQNRMIRHAG
ncbi:ABC transporter permease [Amycolatopsis sp. CA-161197]|uniref:ABC transporter permease n=1 Tax=Amycolatopsis sp. CA-161197 TaxID=3239922 RepID=UPI003D93ED9F